MEFEPAFAPCEKTRIGPDMIRHAESHVWGFGRNLQFAQTIQDALSSRAGHRIVAGGKI